VKSEKIGKSIEIAEYGTFFDKTKGIDNKLEGET